MPQQVTQLTDATPLHGLQVEHSFIIRALGPYIGLSEWFHPNKLRNPHRDQDQS